VQKEEAVTRNGLGSELSVISVTKNFKGLRNLVRTRESLSYPRLVRLRGWGKAQGRPGLKNVKTEHGIQMSSRAKKKKSNRLGDALRNRGSGEEGGAISEEKRFTTHWKSTAEEWNHGKKFMKTREEGKGKGHNPWV